MPAVAQPIETAPRDGTHIIGLARGGWREMWFKRDTYDGDYWTDDMDSEPEPTHWIEMPMMLFENKYVPTIETAPRDPHDFDEDGPEPGEECGRWSNGSLTSSCTKAGSEECDFECPYRSTLRFK